MCFLTYRVIQVPVRQDNSNSLSVCMKENYVHIIWTDMNIWSYVLNDRAFDLDHAFKGHNIMKVKNIFLKIYSHF